MQPRPEASHQEQGQDQPAQPNPTGRQPEQGTPFGKAGSDHSRTRQHAHRKNNLQSGGNQAHQGDRQCTHSRLQGTATQPLQEEQGQRSRTQPRDPRKGGSKDGWAHQTNEGEAAHNGRRAGQTTLDETRPKAL